MFALAKFAQLSVLSIGCFLVQSALAKPTDFSVLNGTYYSDPSNTDPEGLPMYLFDGTSEAGFAEGNVCQFGGKLSQPNPTKLEFIYKNKSRDGVVDSCASPKPLKIQVISVDPKTGMAIKIKVIPNKNDRELGGKYVRQ